MAGDYTSAIQHYSTALRYNPRDTRVLSNRAASYLKLLLWDLCIQVMEVLGDVTVVQDCDAAIRLEPGLVKPHLRRAAALRGLERGQDAREGYERVLTLQPGHQEAEDGLKECQQMLGEYKHETAQFNPYCYR